MSRRTEAQREAWRRLPANKQRLLVSHLPDELERDLSLRHSIVTALENVFGPRVWTAAAARIEDGEETTPQPEEEYAMTYGEIAIELGISPGRVKQIVEGAMRKIAYHHEHLRHFVADVRAPYVPLPPQSTAEDIDRAIARALNIPYWVTSDRSDEP